MADFYELQARDRCHGGLAVGGYLSAPVPIKTGFVPYDTMLGGGLMPGLHFLGGVPAAGKSALACQLAQGLASRGVRVVYFSLEMSWATVGMRCASSWSVQHQKEDGISPIKWAGNDKLRDERHPGIQGVDEFELSKIATDPAYVLKDSMLRTLDAFENGPMRNLAITESTFKLADIEESIKACLWDHVPMVAIVDYLHLIQADGQTETDKIAGIGRALQELAVTYNFPLLAISAISNAAINSDGEPNGTWLKGSGTLAYCAQTITFLTKEKDAVADQNGYVDEFMWLAKNKNGASGIRKRVQFNGAYSHFRIPFEERRNG